METVAVTMKMTTTMSNDRHERVVVKCRSISLLAIDRRRVCGGGHCHCHHTVIFMREFAWPGRRSWIQRGDLSPNTWLSLTFPPQHPTHTGARWWSLWSWWWEDYVWLCVNYRNIMYIKTTTVQDRYTTTSRKPSAGYYTSTFDTPPFLHIQKIHNRHSMRRVIFSFLLLLDRHSSSTLTLTSDIMWTAPRHNQQRK